MIKILRFRFGRWVFGLRVTWKNLRGKEVLGYCNRTEDGMYIPLMDFDDLPLDCIIGEIERLQKDFNLSTFHIFESSKEKYHAVCFDKVIFSQWKEILEHSTCDENFKNVPLVFGRKLWVLRLTDKDKPIQLCASLGREGTRMQSSAHAKLISTWFNIPIELQNPDNLESVKYAKYEV